MPAPMKKDTPQCPGVWGECNMTEFELETRGRSPQTENTESRGAFFIRARPHGHRTRVNKSERQSREMCPAK